MTLSQPLIAYTPEDQLGGVGGMFYRYVVGVLSFHQIRHAPAFQSSDLI
jgi:hypothetical protein